jgi:hypothetical protein
VLQAKKKKFEGPKPTTQMTGRRCWPKRNNWRDRNPQLERQDGAAGPREIIRGIEIHKSNGKTALLAQEK